MRNGSMGWGKWAFVVILLFWLTLLLVGVWQKLRDGEVGWKGHNAISQRHGCDPLGFWISLAFNFLFAVGTLALALAVILDFVPMTWGGR